jgi:hypothetical protein
MRFLTAYFYPASVEPNPATAGEPVIPALPVGDCNRFIGVQTMKFAAFAKVADLPDFDPDAAALALLDEFPGLPLRLHEDSIVAVARAAYSLRTDLVYRVMVTEHSAKLWGVEDDTFSFILWKDRNYEQYL